MITIEELAAQSHAYGCALYGERFNGSLAPGTMALNGDTFANFEIRGPVNVRTFAGETLAAWELARKRPVTRPTWPKSPLSDALYFAVDDCRELGMCRPV